MVVVVVGLVCGCRGPMILGGGVKRSEGKGAGSDQRSDLNRGAASGLGAVTIVTVDPRGSVIIAERVEGEVGAAVGLCATFTVGVVGVGEREVGVVEGSFAASMVGVVVVGGVETLSDRGAGSVLVGGSLLGKSFRRLPYLSQIGRGFLWLEEMVVSSSDFLSRGTLVWSSRGVVGGGGFLLFPSEEIDYWRGGWLCCLCLPQRWLVRSWKW